MRKEEENMVVPELRFPEFINSGNWKEYKLGGLAINLDCKRIPITSNERQKGEVPYYGASGIIDYVKDYIFNEELLCISEDGANLIDRNYPIAFSIIGKTWVNNHAHVLKFENRFTQTLVEKYLNSISLADFLTGMAQPKLNRSKLDIIPIDLPKPAEQQKIADCLSSLDDLITAENQKLDALKAHKKGLMQQLFPAEGETVPKLRFEEFKDKGEWEEKTLGSVATFLKGKGISKSDVVEKGALECIRYGELYTYYKEIINSVKSYTNLPSNDLVLSEANDVIIPSSGETKEDIATASCVLRSGIALGGDLNIIRSEINGVFLSYYLSNAKKNSIAKLAQGDAVVHLYLSQLEKLKINFPRQKEEQKKIASCLSSLDNLMTAQSEKIEALKQHKKGLMQGLFPSVNN